MTTETDDTDRSVLADPTDLSVLSDDAGHINIVALDHRDALKKEFADLDAGEPTEAEAEAAVRRFKADLVDAVAQLERRPSAVMLEPEFSLPDLAERVPDEIAITCALEAQGYFSDPTAGNALMEGWHPARVRDVGAQVAKLLVLYRHDRGSFTERQEALVAQVVSDAAAADVPALIEPVPIDLTGDADRREVIVTSARRLAPMGPMLLKMPYPGSGACGELTEACGDRPWILLSWGVPFDEFAEQLAEACANGCSGFAVGRALWREAVSPETRAEFLSSTFAPRLNQLLDIAATGRRWTDAAP
jgi:tagatose 1,6-diphosphate aldolase